MTATPEELIGRAAEGDSLAVEKLLELHMPTIHRLVRRRMSRALRAREESVDVVQSVCRQVLQGLARAQDQGREGYEHRSEEELRAWLLRVTENKLADHYRRERRERRDVEREEGLPTSGGALPPCQAPGPATMAADREHLESVLSQLTAEEREALELHHFDHLTYQQVADRLGITRKQAIWRIRKGILALGRSRGASTSGGESDQH